MISSFWEWFIIILFIIVIFEADNIHLWKVAAREKLQHIKENISEKKKNSDSQDTKK